MPHLTLVEKGSQKSHRVEGSEVLVGRDPACGVFLDGDEAKTVSGKHARFVFDDTKWYVEDAGSRNGTYVGGRKLDGGARHALAVGDVIGLGLTGTQLAVREAVGRGFAATMLESAPPPRPQAAAGTVPMRLSEAERAGIQDFSADEEARVVLRGVQSGSRSAGQGARVTIGRALECLIRVEGEAATSVSRVHAEIAVANQQVMLRDGGSRHGTFLNGKKIDDTVPIKPGDVIMLGPGGPTFNVEEAAIMPAAPPGSQKPSSPPAREPAIGPTGVRAAAPKVTPSVMADREEKPSYSGVQPTPLDQPAYRQATPDQDVTAYKKPTPAQPIPARKATPARNSPPAAAPRMRPAVWAAIVIVVVVIGAVLLFTRN